MFSLATGLPFSRSSAYCVSFFFFSSRRRHTRLQGDWSSDVCSSDLHMTAQVCCRPPLQAETDRCGCVYVGERPKLDRGVRRREAQAGGRPGGSARGQLGPHLPWHSLHSRSRSPRVIQPPRRGSPPPCVTLELV